MEEIASKLLAHMTIEEDIFYPAVKEIGTKKTDLKIDGRSSVCLDSCHDG